MNENSDLPKDVFEKEKTGLINEASGRGLGFVDINKSDRYTHPELEKLYQTIDRQNIPSSFDATQKGTNYILNTSKKSSSFHFSYHRNLINIVSKISISLKSNLIWKLLIIWIQGLVTSVKDQMTCGSCAAFAATGAHETCMLVSGARFNGLDLSEQYLIDCGYNPAK